jgi:protein-S-isoprenylcysteine O-methyltransferase Ste14
MTTMPAAPAADRTEFDSLLRDYHDARRREDQWRIPQILLALATPLLALVSVVFLMGRSEDFALISGALAIITGVGAALLAIEVWRQHRRAIGIFNHLRTTYPADGPLLLKDPL